MKHLLAGLSLAVLTASAQTVVERPRFEAAAVQRSATATNPETVTSGGVLRGERYQLSKATMLDLIRIAWNVDPKIVFGGPDWLEFDRFDIAAKSRAGTPLPTLRLMLQSLLAERFGLVLHHDTRPMPSFALTQGRSKPKLQESDGLGGSGCSYVPQPTGSIFSAYSCRNVTMAMFAQQLHSLAGDYLVEPVIDQTQLEGSWDSGPQVERPGQTFAARRRTNHDFRCGREGPWALSQAHGFSAAGSGCGPCERATGS